MTAFLSYPPATPPATPRATPPATEAAHRTLSVRHHHATVLLLSLAVVLSSLLLTTVNDRQIALPLLPRFPLPDVCQSRTWLGIDCPGCGLTRSFIHFFHGRWDDSLRMHRFGWLLATLVVLQIPYRLAAILSSRSHPLGTTFPSAIGYGTLGLFAVNWLLKLAGV